MFVYDNFVVSGFISSCLVDSGFISSCLVDLGFISSCLLDSGFISSCSVDSGFISSCSVDSGFISSCLLDFILDYKSWVFLAGNSRFCNKQTGFLIKDHIVQKKLTNAVRTVLEETGTITNWWVWNEPNSQFSLTIIKCYWPKMKYKIRL